jgi:hypothetical protein
MSESRGHCSRDSKKEIKRNKFTHDEDERLVQLVGKYGSDNWEDIAKALGTGRTKRQLRERWQNYLNPDLSPQYSPEEDKQLESLYEQHGSQWAKIAGMLGNKSAISARNRYRTLQSLKQKGLRPEYSEESVTDSSAHTSDSEPVIEATIEPIEFNISHLDEFEFPDIWAFGVGDLF